MAAIDRWISAIFSSARLTAVRCALVTGLTGSWTGDMSTAKVRPAQPRQPLASPLDFERVDKQRWAYPVKSLAAQTFTHK